ncbi:MAG: isoprenylcysteine carboxylmethyltransferase family protein [Hyphomicrobiales bacterium]|nr:MAG: isoprenylcysteine carboxylmethyltransferase family protein [Hyphomicrobiales bacterium]
MARLTKVRYSFPPDAYAALAVVAAILLLEWLVPLSILPPFALLSLATLIGLIIACAGLTLELAAARALTAARTTTRPNADPTALVTTGPFARSRNPFYLGIIALLSGIALIASLDWAIVLVPLFWLALDRLVVPAEEARLAAAFPAVWRAYAGTTGRWL